MVIDLGATDEVLKRLRGKPTAPIPAEPGSRQKHVCHGIPAILARLEGRSFKLVGVRAIAPPPSAQLPKAKSKHFLLIYLSSPLMGWLKCIPSLRARFRSRVSVITATDKVQRWRAYIFLVKYRHEFIEIAPKLWPFAFRHRSHDRFRERSISIQWEITLSRAGFSFL